jgi:hypothetical protein
MPNAARDFVLGNRMVRKGEAFEIPEGQASQFEGFGLVEGKEPQPAEAPTGTETPPLGDGAASPEPGAHETAEETEARAQAEAGPGGPAEQTA